MILRKRLFGDDTNLGEDTARDAKNNPADGLKTAENDNRLDDMRMYTNEEDRHDLLANELLRLTSTMRHNFAVAGSVLKDDNLTLNAMHSVADSNRANLEREGKRLEHHASKSCFEWTMLLMVIFIIWSFIAMIIVMKVFPKR
ncbi:membrane fusion protein use1 domain-containing protein [Ditylenchus destructor]|nr:membrane fusion protein use1 domain-containing protein [Ditylenchus destructor]